MTISNWIQKSGEFFFRYRGQIPAVLFLSGIPVIFYTDYNQIPGWFEVILTILSIVIALSGFAVRINVTGKTPGGTSGRNTDRQIAESLNTTGMYSIVRHPLYLGNLLIWFGLALFTFNLLFVIVVMFFFWFFYERIMVAEEKFLKKKFGDDFIHWAREVPAIIPRFRNFRKSTLPFSWKTVLRREYSGFLTIIFSFAFVDHFRWYVVHNEFLINRISTWILMFAVIITLVLRTMKNRSEILDEEGRT